MSFIGIHADACVTFSNEIIIIPLRGYVVSYGIIGVMRINNYLLHNFISRPFQIVMTLFYYSIANKIAQVYII